MAEDSEKVPAKIEMSSFSLPSKAKIRMLGTDIFLKQEKREKGFSINVPDKIRNAQPSDYVWVLKATF